jgi:hypothetical protein
MTTQSLDAPVSDPIQPPIEQVSDGVDSSPPLIVPAIASDDILAASGPAPESPPPFSPTTATTFDEDTQRRLARADELEAQYREFEVENSIRGELEYLRQEAEQRGLHTEDQEWLLAQHGKVLRQGIEQQRQFRLNQEYIQGKRNACQSIGLQYGVDPREMEKFNFPQDMHDYGKQQQSYRQEKASWEKRLTTMEQGRVQPAHQNAVGISRAGGQAVTRDNIDALYLEGRVTGDTYNRFLSTGIIR